MDRRTQMEADDLVSIAMTIFDGALKPDGKSSDVDPQLEMMVRMKALDAAFQITARRRDLEAGGRASGPRMVSFADIFNGAMAAGESVPQEDVHPQVFAFKVHTVGEDDEDDVAEKSYLDEAI